jgi:dTDP-4-amino-4,6-dideoxygalactose transaminase
MTNILAINGGQKSITEPLKPELLRWPIVTDEDRNAILEVLDNRKMSGTDITKKFEKEYAEWLGVKYALGYCNGTSAIHAAMWACGVGAGDEVICPSMTYWASCTAALSLGAAVNFADIDRETLCIDPADIEHRIGPATRAIIVVHYSGYPADMDEIMAIARKHNVKVIEDVSHAHGTLYKGQMTGTIGDIAGMSLMTGKAFAMGEAGLITTNNRELYERCIAYGHYERTGVISNFNPADSQLTDKELLKFRGIPQGGYKHRLNQWCSAMGRVQLKHYPDRIAEIDKAMNYFCDLLDSMEGLKTHRPPADSGSTKGGWYNTKCFYYPEKLKGVSASKFCDALKSEGLPPEYTLPGVNFPLHLHPVFHEADIFNMGAPTMLSFGQRDVRQGKGSLPVSEKIDDFVIGIPRFVKFDQETIEQVANTYRKVTINVEELVS